MVVGIETDRSPWVQALIIAGYQVYAINPLQVARCRERHAAKSRRLPRGPRRSIAQLNWPPPEWVDRYSHRRLRSTLGYLPPVEYEPSRADPPRPGLHGRTPPDRLGLEGRRGTARGRVETAAPRPPA